MWLYFELELTTWLIGTAIAIAIYYWYTASVNHYWRRKNVPSDNPQNFATAMLIALVKGKTLGHHDQEQRRKHGNVSGLYFKCSPALLLSDPDLIKMILVKDFQSFQDKRSKVSHPVVGKMLVSLEGAEWKRMRNILTRVFTPGKMRKLAHMINKSAESVTKSFLEYADSKTTVDLKKQYGGFSLDVIASTAFGLEMDSIKNPDNIFAKFAGKIYTTNITCKTVLLALAPKLMKFMGHTVFDVEATKFFVDFILKTIEQRKNGGEVRDDFLQMLVDIESDTAEEKKVPIENGHDPKEAPKTISTDNIKKSLTGDDLAAQCIMFFLVGFESPGSNLSLTCYLLALNPECQERLQAEVDETWEKNQNKMDYDIVNSMTYLDAVVSESLRLYSTSTRLKRLCVKDYVLGDTGITIPKGMLVFIPSYAMHRDAEHFPEPEKFDPERFLPENRGTIKPYTYLPFGDGPRNCIGMRFALMELKLCLVHVLRRVTFYKCPETQIPLQFAYFNDGTVIKPKAVTVGVTRR